MTNFHQHPFRIAGRLIWLASELALASVRYLVEVTAGPPGSYDLARSLWMQRCARRLLRVLHIRLAVTGSIPDSGLLVSNHLSYLDILVLGAVAPSIFVSKEDVKSWPVFGWLTRLAGTIFVDRTSRLAVKDACLAIQQSLNDGNLVVLFPEGTSTDGTFVSAFRPALLEPALGRRCLVTLAGLRYFVDQEDPSREVCYWGTMVFLSHLVNLLGIEAITARVELIPAASVFDRKDAARAWRSQIIALLEKSQTHAGSPPVNLEEASSIGAF